jgi:hypothetical protein
MTVTFGSDESSCVDLNLRTATAASLRSTGESAAAPSSAGGLLTVSGLMHSSTALLHTQPVGQSESSLHAISALSGAGAKSATQPAKNIPAQASRNIRRMARPPLFRKIHEPQCMADVAQNADLPSSDGGKHVKFVL